MNQRAPELSVPNPQWDVERQKVADILSSRPFGVKPRTQDQRDVLLIAKGLYARTREQAQPFLDALFDDGQARYFQQLATASYSIRNSVYPKKGEVPAKTLEELTDERSAEIINHLADLLDQREQTQSSGLSEVGKAPNSQWPQVFIEKPDFIKAVEGFGSGVRGAIDAGASESSWLPGLRVVQAKLHNNLNLLDQEIKAKRPAETAEETIPEIISPEDGTAINDKINQLAMVTIDDIERALTAVNRHEWRERFSRDVKSLVELLEAQSISRLVPKVGDVYDPKWQKGLYGSGDRVASVQRGAFVDKTTGRVIQEAWVEVK